MGPHSAPHASFARGKRPPLPSMGHEDDRVGASALFAGWLEKKGGGGADGSMRNWAKGGRRNWKKRWMVLDSKQFLSWYDSGPSPKPKDLKGSLALHGAQVAASERPGGFWVMTNSRACPARSPSGSHRPLLTSP